MGTRTRARVLRAERNERLTPRMRSVLAVVGALIAVGLGLAAWATMRGDDALPGGAPSSTTPSPEVTAPGASPGATPVSGSEVTDPGPTATDAARLPALPQPTPLVTAPLPADAAANGRVADGLPVALIGPAPDSDVIDSSVASDGSTLQATLTARTDRSAAEVAAHYRDLWAALSLTAAAGDLPAGELAYADHYTAVSLSAVQSGTGTVYTLYATLRSE